MFEQFMWNKFLKSGNVYDYLVLKEEINFSDAVEKESAHQSAKNGNSGILKIF